MGAAATQELLAEIASGRISPSAVRPLREAEFRRHLILVEAVRRRVLAAGPDAEFGTAHRRLVEAERTDPERAFAVLGAPQVGVWAARCLHAPTIIDSRYLQQLAAKLIEPLEEPEITAVQAGLTLALAVDGDDPYLDFYGERDPAPDLTAWRDVVDAGWFLLTRHLRPTAAAMAETLRTLVPLRSPGRGKVHSATSGLAFGAIAASLPGDALECAETLQHEFRHVVLGAIINDVPLVDPEATWTGQVPWRPDPRPAEATLQGCFAYAGLIGLWRRLLDGDYDERARAALLTWADATDQTMADLAKSGALTEAGQAFLTAMRHSL